MGLATRPTARAALLTALPVALGGLALAPALASPRGAVQAKTAAVSATAAFKFDPATVTVAVGGKVTFTNAGGGFHTVTGGDGTNPDPASPIGDHDLPAAGATITVTFPKAGTFAYYCKPHASLGMKGSVVVGAAGPATTAPATSPPSATASPVSTGASVPPASGSASASVGEPQPGAGAPTAGPSSDEVPGIADNKTLQDIDAERKAYHGAVSGFRFFTLVAIAFLVILGAAVLFSTRPRRAGR
jgi:plastocyanin